MGENLRRTHNEPNVLVPKHRALETMEELGYNPVREMVELVNCMKAEDERDYKAEIALHKTLLSYYSSAPRHIDVNVSGSTNHNFTMIKPAGFMEDLAKSDPKMLEPCSPKVIDITGGYLTGDEDE